MSDQQTITAVDPAVAERLLFESGALLEGHFLLSSGLHSSRYFQCARLMEIPARGEEVSRAVAAKCRDLQIQTVLAPALGALLFGYELSRQLGCRNIFAERPGGAFELRRGFSLEPGERVLIAENVITTGGSVLEVAELVRSTGANLLGFAAIVDRSGGKFQPGAPLIRYAALDAPVYESSTCPMCAAGTPLDKPGSRKTAKA